MLLYWENHLKFDVFLFVKTPCFLTSPQRHWLLERQRPPFWQLEYFTYVLTYYTLLDILDIDRFEYFPTLWNMVRLPGTEGRTQVHNPPPHPRFHRGNPLHFHQFYNKRENYKWKLNVGLGKGNAALCCFLCRELSIGKFKLQVSFSSGLFVSDKNIWSALLLSFIYLGASWLQAHKPANLQKNQ